jgi:prephenate dehydrogenase
LDARLNTCVSWLEKLWVNANCTVHKITCEEHDRLAGTTQVGTLLSILIQADLVSSEPNIRKLKELSTPYSRALQERADHMLRHDKSHLNVYPQISK